MRSSTGNLRKLTFAAAVFCLSVSTAVAQDARIELFEGGNMKGELGFHSQLMTGAGTNGAIGGFIAPYSPDPFVIFGNPAALNRIKGRKIVISSSPTIEFDLRTLVDPATAIQNPVDQSLEGIDPNWSGTYPEMKGSLGRTGSLLNGFAINIPLSEDSRGGWFDGSMPALVDQLAFGYYEPFEFRYTLIYSGLRMRMRTINHLPDGSVDPNPAKQILFYSSMSSNLDFRISSDSWNMSAAKQIGDLSLGLGFQRTGIRLGMNALVKNDGIMSMAGVESSFNNPNSPFDTRYFQSMDGSFSGSAWATRLGATYTSGDWILGGLVRLQNTMTMTGDLSMESHNFAALRLMAPAGTKRFDVNKIDDASELTKTTTKVIVPASDMTVNLPGEISIAATYTGFMKPTINFTKYLGELSFEFDQTEGGGQFHYKRGYKPDMGASLGLNLSFIQLMVGVVRMQDVVAGYVHQDGTPFHPEKPILIPRFCLGFDAGLSDKLTLGVLVDGLPEDILRLTLMYSI